jgi:molecular chaperone DnaJ
MDPYKVLGVNRNTTMEEIRAAYLALVKKYHPDKYQDAALKELAEERLKEINEAYDLLTRQGTSAFARTGASSSSGYGYSGQGGSYSGPNAAEFSLARALINANDLEGSKRVLDSIQTRNAEWYYLCGEASLGLGNRIAALNYARQAVSMNPNNFEYSALLSRLEGSAHFYQSAGSEHGFGRSSFVCGNPCLTCCVGNMLCNCLCNGCFCPAFYC